MDGGMNKYGAYRYIRFRRTNRTLGKMTWWRVVLGLILLASVFFISGAVSDFFAARGRFHTAERLMLAPGWVERYRPELKAYFAAGVLYEDGDYERAFAAAREIPDFPQARALESAAAVKLAAQRLDALEPDAAFDSVCAADRSLLDEGLRAEYQSVCEALLAHYARLDSLDAQAKLRTLKSLLGEQAS